jgi:hypothetical protein
VAVAVAVLLLLEQQVPQVIIQQALEEMVLLLPFQVFL